MTLTDHKEIASRHIESPKNPIIGSDIAIASHEVSSPRIMLLCASGRHDTHTYRSPGTVMRMGF